MSRLLCIGLAFVLSALAVAPARAIDILPDNLDGPCCETTQAVLPQFPDIDLRTKYICWRDCDPRLSGTVLTKFTFTPIACGYYLARMTVTNVAGTFTAWTSTQVMAYSRTWLEASNNQTPDTQVWRFFLNGDLRIDPFVLDQFGGNGCIVPSCYTAFNAYHWRGYIDIARDCNNQFTAAFAINHECDAFEHSNNFTSRPGVFHPNNSYTMVGPADSFVCDPNLGSAEGPINCEAFRNYDFTQPLDQICQFEQPLEGGDIVNEGDFCPCGVAGATAQYKVQQFAGQSLCGSTASSAFVGPWPGMLSKSIGLWTDPTRFPGVETLHLEQTHMAYTDGCNGQQTRPFFYGVQTTRGFPTFKIGPTSPGGPIVPIPVVDRFIDLGSSTLPQAQGAPVIGKRSIVDKVIELNVEF